jgi:hypothetical protein
MDKHDTCDIDGNVAIMVHKHEIDFIHQNGTYIHICYLRKLMKVIENRKAGVQCETVGKYDHFKATL